MPEFKVAVAEAMIRANGGDSSKILEALSKGKVFKEAGLRPFYVYDEDEGELIVTSAEAMENRLH
jgi:hypothetical protein